MISSPFDQKNKLASALDHLALRTLLLGICIFYFFNLWRSGGIVSEKDLYPVLRDKKIRAAYFDVFTTEPPKADEPLMTLPNFHLTPHIGSRTSEAELNTCRIATEQILLALA